MRLINNMFILSTQDFSLNRLETIK